MTLQIKATIDMGQSPINLTGMLTHGHGDGAYMHIIP